MKKLLSLVAIAAFMLAMAGCAVNANTGSITVNNLSDKAATGVKVGTVTIGYVGSGEVKTVYFFKNEDAAKVVAKDFENSNSTITKDEINLKTNYLYTFNLYQLTNDKSKYVFNVTGTEIKATGNYESLIAK